MSQPTTYRLFKTTLVRQQVDAATDAAMLALDKAYQPYSKFRVGCAILCTDGSVFKGCNVETANYDGTHAEGSALAAMVVAGRRDPVLCVCLGALEGQPPVCVMSCGKCRQALMEFSSLSGKELWVRTDPVVGPEWSTGARFMKLSDLLPCHFGPADIGVDIKKYRR
jgi:cytidine deaminase